MRSASAKLRAALAAARASINDWIASASSAQQRGQRLQLAGAARALAAIGLGSELEQGCDGARTVEVVVHGGLEGLGLRLVPVDALVVRRHVL
ncbi:hypothetical protein G6F68_020110 [Rhizopus microsporus]|nr:hypothetical protein G6F68_020110 [Rhizopus microsporus]